MAIFRELPKWDFPLYQGDDRARLAELHTAVENAEAFAENAAKENQRMGDEKPGLAEVQAARKAYNDFIDEVMERTPSLVCQTIGSQHFHDLLLAHPPRMVATTGQDGEATEVVHEDDRGWGFNFDTLQRALLAYRRGATRTIVFPEFASDSECQEFVDNELTEGERVSLFLQAVEQNRGGSVDPKSLQRFNVTPASVATSD